MALSQEEGIRAAYEAAGPRWRRDALDALQEVARNQSTLTADDVWEELGLETRENSAMGGVFRTGIAEGWIVNTNRKQPRSNRESNHRDLTIWASRLYTGNDAVEVQVCTECNGLGSILSPVRRSRPMLRRRSFPRADHREGHDTV